MKASEVFDLPVSVGEYNMDNDNIYSASSEWCATLFSDEQAKVAANCINHADALADALEDLFDAVTNRSSHDSINNQIIAAALVLAAYRGTK